MLHLIPLDAISGAEMGALAIAVFFALIVAGELAAKLWRGGCR